MAKYRQLMIQDKLGWHLMSPSSPWEALRMAWMMWRYPDRIAALVGVSDEYMLAHCRLIPSNSTELELPFGAADAGA